MAVKPIPDGYHSVTPYLVVRDAARARVLQEGVRRRRDVAHARWATRSATPRSRSAIRTMMLADEIPDMGTRARTTLGGSPVSLMVYVEDVDARVRARVAAGGEGGAAGRRPVLRRPHRRLDDPFGHVVRSPRTSRTSRRTRSRSARMKQAMQEGTSCLTR